MIIGKKSRVVLRGGHGHNCSSDVAHGAPDTDDGKELGGAMHPSNMLVTMVKNLTPAELDEMVQTLQKMLKLLPLDGTSNADERLRHDLEVLVTGYEMGQRSARQSPPTGVESDAENESGEGEAREK